MNQTNPVEDFSPDNAAKLKEIRVKQQNNSICPNIDYIEQNLEAFSRISSQFYNPEIHQALTCLLQTFIEKTGAQRSPTPSNDALDDLTGRIQGFFASRKNGDKVLEYLTIRTVDTRPGSILYYDQVDQLINEAYVGIKYLNDLRAITPSFKYIYVVITRQLGKTGKLTPYIVEEALNDALPLRSMLNTLPPTETGVNTVKSIILQLMTAVHYASKINVSNFPMEIVVRPVGEAVLPIFLEDSITYVNTYGWVPVFHRYYTAGSPFGGGIEHPKSLYQDQNDILQHIISTLNAVNPNLAKMIKCTGPITANFFTEITQIRDNVSRNSTILTCNASAQVATCMTIKDIIRYFTVPFSRVDTYVKSGTIRIDELRAMLNGLSNDNVGIDQAFIISPVIVRYAQLLQDVAAGVNDKTRRQLFAGERYHEIGITEDRYIDLDRLIVKDDLVFVNESANLLKTQYVNQRYIKDFLDAAMSTGDQLRRQQQDMPLPDLTTRQGLFTGIQNLRTLISNIYYYETTNAVIENYRQQIGTYRNDFDDAINEAEFIKEKFEITFANAGMDGKTPLIDKFVKLVNNADDAILVRLYDIFIEDIQDPLETLLHNYEVRRTPEELNSLNRMTYEQKVLASDPIPLLGI